MRSLFKFMIIYVSTSCLLYMSIHTNSVLIEIIIIIIMIMKITYNILTIQYIIFFKIYFNLNIEKFRILM